MNTLPERAGPRPATTSVIPHSQTDQQPSDDRYLAAILKKAGTWDGVVLGESGISVAGARAMTLAAEAPAGPAEAFMVEREFGHGHAQGDYSLHLTLPLELVDQVAEAGWTEPHFLVLTGLLPPTHVMLYAPRNDHEVDVAIDIVRASYEFASGVTSGASMAPTE